ncbi:MAG: deoxyribose-phosphate aldolase [Spirochaetales bacterium]|nr:deoxyribose-phosphate aldolase [Spirochaetales bacterium]
MAGPNLADYIDHTYLKPQGTDAEISALCNEAKEYGFFSVCVNPCWITLCKKLLAGSKVRVAAVIGFPLGAMTSEAKAWEAAQAVGLGADELDMVINIGRLRAGDDEYVRADIGAVVEKSGKALVKVIIENCLLTKDEKIRACRLAKQAGAGFVKTSTGFNGEGATVEDVKLMRETVGPDMGVKAAGGVRTRDDALAMIRAGATRIGTSGGVQIVSGGSHQAGY